MDLQEMTGALQEARKWGAFGVEALYTEDVSKELVMEGGRVGPETETTSSRVDVKVWLEGGRQGDAGGAPSDIMSLLEQACAAAETEVENPHHGPATRQSVVPGGLSIRDRRHEQLTRDDRAEVLSTAYRAAIAEHDQVETHGFRYRDRHRIRRFVNSRGLASEEFGTIYMAEGEVSVPTPEGSIHLWDSIASRSFASIASLPYGTGLGRRAAQLVQDVAEPVSGPVRVLLPARAVAIVLATLADGFARTAMLDDKDAFFLIREGRNLDGRLHLLDDATLPGGLRTRAFDDRGVVPIPLTLLREGVLEGGYRGLRQSRVHDAVATGHEIGGALQPTNLVLKSGTRSVNATLSDLGGTTFMVDALPRDAIDRVTGQVDARVNGVVMEANQGIGAMRNVRLTGHLGDVLRGVVEVCSDTDRVGHVDAAALIVEGFTLE